MRRVMIVGSAGSGKSTLARALGRRLQLPVIHLDPLFWRPGWKEPEREAFQARVSGAIGGDAWITDGNFVGDTFALRLPRADTLIVLDRSPWVCLARVLWRACFQRHRADLPEGCRESIDADLIGFVTHFRTKTLPRVEALLAAHSGDLRVVRLRSDADVKALLASAA